MDAAALVVVGRSSLLAREFAARHPGINISVDWKRDDEKDFPERYSLAFSVNLFGKTAAPAAPAKAATPAAPPGKAATPPAK